VNVIFNSNAVAVEGAIFFAGGIIVFRLAENSARSKGFIYIKIM